MKEKVLSNPYLATFCLEIAMLLQTGITLSDGILLLKDDEEEAAGQAVTQSLLDNLEKGEPLSVALHASPYFPVYMTNMVEIGEKTGRLVDTLKELSRHYERQERLGLAIKNAVLYPAILLALMIAVVLVLIVQVLPIFDDVFARLGAHMSPLATGLMQFGGWLSDAAVIIAAFCAIAFVMAILAWLSPNTRRWLKKSFMDTFGGRGVWGKIASSRFVSSMALAISSGLDTEEAVSLSAMVSGGVKAVDEKHLRCVELLRSGVPLAEAMRQSGLLSARNSRMLSLGGKSGMADAAMSEIARRCDAETQDEIDHLVGRVEPTLVIITSLIVGIILLSVMLPLMGIMSSIG